MSLIDTLERKYSRYLPENLTYYLVIGQILAYIVSYANPKYAGLLPLQGQLVFSGQVWRLVTFAFTPLSQSIIFVAFAWYFLYLYGSMLERRWGSFRYLTYLLLFTIGSILCSFLFPQFVITNGYLYASLFLAFSYLYPDMQLLLFFVIPVKVKWLGIFAWVGVVATLLLGTVPEKVLAIFSLSNFFFFFGEDLLFGIRTGFVLPKSWQSDPDVGLKNICAVCGKYEMEYRDLEFRYCTDCDPATCYCTNHLELHRHKKLKSGKRVAH